MFWRFTLLLWLRLGDEVGARYFDQLPFFCYSTGLLLLVHDLLLVHHIPGACPSWM
jgi:hypothetical protein